MIVPDLTDAMVELHVQDFLLTRSFYNGLGFEVVREEPDYLVMQRQESVLCFYGGSDGVSRHPYFKKFPKETPRGYGVEIILPVDDVVKVYEEWKSHACVVEELKLKRWGLKDFRIVDPFGFYIRVTERSSSPLICAQEFVSY